MWDRKAITQKIFGLKRNMLLLNPRVQINKEFRTCWNLMSKSKATGSLGLQTGGTVYSMFWAVVQGISFTV